jgi:hypothetical protein
MAWSGREGGIYCAIITITNFSVIAQKMKNGQSMSLGQNDKNTHKSIFVFSNTIFHP